MPKSVEFPEYLRCWTLKNSQFQSGRCSMLGHTRLLSVQSVYKSVFQ